MTSYRRLRQLSLKNMYHQSIFIFMYSSHAAQGNDASLQTVA